jgi:hypothetical protein
MFGVMAAFVLMLVALASAIYVFASMRPLWQVFYLSWALAIILGIAAPILIAHVVAADTASLDRECTARVRSSVIRESMYDVLPFPVEVKAAVCPAETLSEPTSWRVIVRGPYGMEMSEGSIGDGSIHHPTDRDVNRAFLILLAGCAAVSLPFVSVLLVFGTRRMRLGST